MMGLHLVDLNGLALYIVSQQAIPERPKKAPPRQLKTKYPLMKHRRILC